MPVAKFFFFFYGEVRSKKETDQMRPEGQVSRRKGSFGCLRLKRKASLQLGGGEGGGVDLQRVDVCHLGLSGACFP